MRTTCGPTLALIALAWLATTPSCATSSAPSSGVRLSIPAPTPPRADAAHATATRPAYLTPPLPCTEQLPPLPTWEPDDAAAFLRLRGTLTIDPDEWATPFHGVLVSHELRAREVERRRVQAERLRLALRMRDTACRQWLGRVEGMDRDLRWQEVDRARLVGEAAQLRWLVVGAAGSLVVVALVAVAAGG